MSDAAPVTTESPVVAHAWMPSSPCGAGCIPRDPAGVHVAFVVVRVLLALVAFGLLPVLILVGLLSTKARRTVTRLGARLLLMALGIGLQIHDRRTAREMSRTEHGALLVAGHVSWTDVLVLTALRPATFVARGDLVDWPVLGVLARSMKVLSIDRQNLRALPTSVNQVAEKLRAGGTVVVFPEGTTWCGRAYDSFRPALFQAAIDTETWVQPVRLRYVDATGEGTTSTCFVGDESIVESIGRIFRLKGIVAEVELTAPEAPGTDRRDLARRCEVAARAVGSEMETMHAVIGGEISRTDSEVPGPTSVPAG